MSIGPFVLISLMYCVIGLRTVRDLLRHWGAVWDNHFTPAERGLVGQAAFFVLIPVSVALHELGHAVMVWLLGGEVTGFGYFFFAGYVEHRGLYTNSERILIALAGPLVNVLLTALALAMVVWWRRPLRAAINELLIQFAFINLVNALIFYPLLNLATGMAGGDWGHIYDGGEPRLSLAIGIAHAAILAAGWWMWHADRPRQLLNQRTGLPPTAERGLLGGLRPPRKQRGPQPGELPVEARLRAAGERVVAGWDSPAQLTIQRRQDGSVLLISWDDLATARAVVVAQQPDGDLSLSGVALTDRGASQRAIPRRLGLVPGTISEDHLTLELRLAMETVASWDGAGSTIRPAPSSRPSQTGL